MKKLLLILIIFFVAIGCDFENKNDAANPVKNYLNNYINLKDNVLEQLEAYVETEELSNSQREIYKEILIKQYQDLKYNIEQIEYDGNIADVVVIISVTDLYKVNSAVTKYLEENIDEFKDETGNYDKTLFLEYKMEEMKKAIDKVDYTIIFRCVKNDGSWTIEQPSNTVLEKIHGIYDYDNK